MEDVLKQSEVKKHHDLPIVFVADDNEMVRMKIKYLLEAEKMHVHLADNGQDLLRMIEADRPDLIILDVNLPVANATDILHSLKQKEETRSVLVMLMSPAAGTLRNIQGLTEGADDFLSKPFFNGLLVAKVKAMLRLKALQNDLKEANEKLEILSVTDPLTGLYNYRHLYRRLGEEVAAATRYKTPLSCVSFDIDHFKSVNDSLGHQFGDVVLSEFAKILEQPTRKSDIVARNGGEEFMIVLPRTPIDKAAAVANRVLELVREHRFKNDDQAISLTTSAGVTGITGMEPISVDEIIRRVDIALYKAKRGGRNRACMWVPGDKLYPAPEAEMELETERRIEIAPEAEDAKKPAREEKAALSSEVEQTSLESISALVSAFEAKDASAMKQSKKVSELAEKLALALNLGTERAAATGRAALLHDIGKIGISDEILRKSGPLTEAECKIIRKHPDYSVNILKSVKAMASELPTIRHHHERYDGTGYPDGLSGEKIPIGARILAVADTFVAMTTDSRYKKALKLAVAIGELKRLAGTQLDPTVVDTLLALVNSQQKKE